MIWSDRKAITAFRAFCLRPDVCERRVPHRHRVVMLRIDSGGSGMKTVTPEQARGNIIAAYEKQHKEGVSALSSAIERVKGSKTTEGKKDAADSNAKSDQSAKPELSKLFAGSPGTRISYPARSAQRLTRSERSEAGLSTRVSFSQRCEHRVDDSQQHERESQLR